MRFRWNLVMPKVSIIVVKKNKQKNSISFPHLFKLLPLRAKVFDLLVEGGKKKAEYNLT